MSAVRPRTTSIKKEPCMSLNIDRIAVGDPGTEHALKQVLEEVGVPAGEEWTASIVASPRGSWEVVLDGAARTKSEHFDWENVAREGGTHFRKLYHGRDEQTPEHIKREARKLLWECVQFKDNPIRNVSPALGEAFEETVWNLLRHEDMSPVQVRFGIWREGPDGMKFVCKVEYSHARRVPWTWWSGLARTPQDLATELGRALLARRKRQSVSSSGLGMARRTRRARVAPAAPGAPSPAAAEEQRPSL
jgi:hypothetical protein